MSVALKWMMTNCTSALSVERHTVRNVLRKMEQSKSLVCAQTVKRSMRLKKTTGVGNNRPARNAVCSSCCVYDGLSTSDLELFENFLKKGDLQLF